MRDTIKYGCIFGLDGINGRHLNRFFEGVGRADNTEVYYVTVFSFLGRFLGGKDFREVTEEERRWFM